MTGMITNSGTVRLGVLTFVGLFGVDLKTAIELSRYDKTSQGGRSDLDEWTALLETWEIEPTR